MKEMGVPTPLSTFTMGTIVKKIITCCSPLQTISVYY
jgi:hypothetical protein